MAASNFDRSLLEILRHEGGYVDDSRDPGGATNLGITLATARENGMDLDGDGDVDKADIRAMTPKAAGRIYKARYWNAAHCDGLPSGLDLMVFDCAVNQGPVRARRWLQEAAGVQADGILGPVSMRAIKTAKPADLIRRFSDLRKAHYRSLATFDVFGRGWMRRLTETTAKSLTWASSSPASRSA